MDDALFNLSILIFVSSLNSAMRFRQTKSLIAVDGYIRCQAYGKLTIIIPILTENIYTHSEMGRKAMILIVFSHLWQMVHIVAIFRN